MGLPGRPTVALRVSFFGTGSVPASEDPVLWQGSRPVFVRKTGYFQENPILRLFSDLILWHQDFRVSIPWCHKISRHRHQGVIFPGSKPGQGLDDPVLVAPISPGFHRSPIGPPSSSFHFGAIKSLYRKLPYLKNFYVMRSGRKTEGYTLV